MHKPFTVVDHSVVVERQDVSDLECHPFPETILWFVGNAQVIFSNKCRIIPFLDEAFGQGLEFPNRIPFLRPSADNSVIQPGVNTVLRRHQPCQHGCPAR